MTWALDTVVRTSIVLASGLTAAAALRHRRAALRHAVLAGSIFGAAIVPFGTLLPRMAVPLPGPELLIGVLPGTPPARQERSSSEKYAPFRRPPRLGADYWARCGPLAVW